MLMGSLALIGCGDGDANTDASAGPASHNLTKAAFVKRGNEICKRGLAEKDDAVHVGLEELGQMDGRPSHEELAKFAAGALPAYRSMTDQLSQLTPPAKDRKVVEDFVVAFQAALKRTEAKPEILIEHDPFEQAAIKAQEYGLSACTA